MRISAYRASAGDAPTREGYPHAHCLQPLETRAPPLPKGVIVAGWMVFCAFAAASSRQGRMKP